MPGMRLRRLANYRRGPEATRRFAALYYDDDGALAPSHTWLIDDGWRLAVIAEHARGTSWSVLVDFDADDVSERLEHLQAYPLDLDAVGHGMSVRFASVAAK